MRLKVSSVKWRPFCLGLNVLINFSQWNGLWWHLWSLLLIRFNLNPAWISNHMISKVWLWIFATLCHWKLLRLSDIDHISSMILLVYLQLQNIYWWCVYSSFFAMFVSHTISWILCYWWSLNLHLCIFSCDQAAIWLVQSVRPSVRPSVCLSVRHTFFTMFPSSYHHEIFRSYYHGQKWCPCKRSMSEVKGQGHRGQHPT